MEYNLQRLSFYKRAHLRRTLSLILFCAVMLLCETVYAQNTTSVSGTVTDAKTGETLAGVNIAVKGTTNGTFTDSDGHYQLDISKPDAILLFTFIGYKKQTKPVNDQSTIDVQLTSTTANLENLIVVGYSSKKKKDLTGAVSVVDVENLTKSPDAQVENQLQGQASGVNVISSGQPGEQPTVRIRGVNTFGNNTPLYVVDGVPTQNIKDLNSNDIASLQVLKDASAASIYGSRASNGVIIITTKKGQGDVSVTYRGSVGTQRPNNDNPWNKLNPTEMAQLKWQVYKNEGLLGLPNFNDPQYGDGAAPKLPNYIIPTGADEADASTYYLNPNFSGGAAEFNTFNQIVKANKQGTNWHDAIFSPAAITNQNISVSGGGEQGNYLFSFNYKNHQGTLMNTYLKRYTIRSNTNFHVSDHFSIGENLAYSKSDNPQVNGLSEGSAIGMAMRMRPLVPVYDIMGNFAGTHATGFGNADNPVAMRYNSRNNAGSGNRLFGNAFAQVDFLNAFNLRTSFGGEIYSSMSNYFNYPTYSDKENSFTNLYGEDGSSGHNWTWTNTLTFNHTFNDLHAVKVLAGTEAYESKGGNLGGTTTDYFSFDPAYTNLSTGSGTKTNYSNHYEDELFSLIGRIDYSFNDRYLISGTIRRDGSSRFLNNRYGWFPAGSVGWRISEESFMQNIDWLSDLKIRGGYGVLGNQLNVDVNNPYTLYGGNLASSYYPITGSNSSLIQGFQQNRIGNPDAKWERDVSMNFGIDAGLFDGALQITADYYKKNIKDLLYNPALPGTEGTATAPFVNVGRMTNSGIDASVNGIFPVNKNVQINGTVTFTTYNNEIKEIAEGVPYFSRDGRRFGGQSIIRNAKGHAISSFYGYNIVGFYNDSTTIDNLDSKAPGDHYQKDAAPGRFRYEDINKDGQINSADRKFLGSPNPDYSYGINLGANIKNFDISAFFYGVQGNEIWNNTKWWLDFYSGFPGGKSKTALYDSWSPKNHNATAPIQEQNRYASTSDVPNSYFVEDGSYLRLKNLQIGYTLPAEVMNRVGLKNLRVYVQATNLFTITGYSGIDPEIGGNNGNATDDFGIDEGSYSTPRQYLVGISIKY